MWFKSRFTITAFAAISFCLMGGTVPAAADILHVPGDYLTIQEAIDAAVDGDVIRRSNSGRQDRPMGVLRQWELCAGC